MERVGGSWLAEKGCTADVLRSVFMFDLLLLGTVKEQARIRAAAGASNSNLAAALVMSSHRTFCQGAEGGGTNNRTSFSTLYPSGFPYRFLFFFLFLRNGNIKLLYSETNFCSGSCTMEGLLMPHILASSQFCLKKCSGNEKHP
jgi:hypothetical protein